MKPDLYTKAVLTVIALMLAVIAIKPLVNPDSTASAQGAFAGVQYVVDRGSNTFFDARTGDMWYYNGDKIYHSKLTKLGQPMQNFGEVK